MASNSGTLTFRPRREMEGDYGIIEEWCQTNKIPIGAVFNSYLPAIAYALTHWSHVDEDGKIWVLSDFAHVPILPGKENQTNTEYLS